MSDHWKSLANQFGIPGPADPPEIEKHVERAPVPAASQPSVAVPSAPPVYKPPQPIAAAPPAAPTPRPVDDRSARKRSSMWGDDSEGESPQIETPKVAGTAAPAYQSSPAPTVTPVAAPRAIAPQPTAPQVAAPRSASQREEHRPAPTPPRTEQPSRRHLDPLEAIVSVDREPTVPGFDVPEDRSPGAVKVPVRRSAWDTLIGTLGIRTSSDPVAEKPAKPAPEPEKPVAETREPDLRQPRGRDRDAGSQRREQPAFSREEPRDEEVSSGFGAGLIDSDKPSPRSGGAEPRPESDEDRPRGRGRRGGSRRRGRGGDRDIEPAAESKGATDIVDIDWELDAGDDDLDAPIGETRSPGIDPEPQPRLGSDDEDGEFRGRPRRSRRRGQRQMLSVEDVESGLVAGQSDTSRAPSPRNADSPADRPRRREETGGRERGPRSETGRSETGRSESTRSETGRGESARAETPRGEGSRGDSPGRDGGRPDRAPRPPRGRAEEPATRSAPRSEARRPESVRGDDDFVEFDDDDADGFGSGLLAEAKPVADEGDEPRARPRRRRGRRGRGGSAREDRPEVEGSAELIAAPDEVLEVPAFDDDLEDDDEADRLRRRSRGGRSRAGRRPVGDRETEPVDRETEPAPRGVDFVADPKSRSVPTWLDTVSLLVDSNIQRRSSGGGGGSGGGNRNQGNQGNQGRGGRR